MRVKDPIPFKYRDGKEFLRTTGPAPGSHGGYVATPEIKLISHIQAAHAGKFDPECQACLELTLDKKVKFDP